MGCWKIPYNVDTDWHPWTWWVWVETFHKTIPGHWILHLDRRSTIEVNYWVHRKWRAIANDLDDRKSYSILLSSMVKLMAFENVKNVFEHVHCENREIRKGGENVSLRDTATGQWWTDQLMKSAVEADVNRRFHFCCSALKRRFVYIRL